jgi:hypothetical protein
VSLCSRLPSDHRAPATVNFLFLVDSVGWKECVRDVATGHDGYAGLGVVMGLLSILHPFCEDGLPDTGVVLQVSLVTIEKFSGGIPSAFFS